MMCPWCGPLLGVFLDEYNVVWHSWACHFERLRCFCGIDLIPNDVIAHIHKNGGLYGHLLDCHEYLARNPEILRNIAGVS